MNESAIPVNCGGVVAVRGSVVDVRFYGHLPPINSVPHAGNEGQIVTEVRAQSDAPHMRGIPRQREREPLGGDAARRQKH